MDRLKDPTILAAIALVALILLIAGVILLQRQSSEQDRLTGEETASPGANAEERCADRQIYERIKREIFRRAAEVRGSDQAAYDRIAGSSTVRMEAPVLRDENRTAGSLTCNGTFTLDLPPGLMVAGGRRSLSADILYTIEGGAVAVTDADEIIRPLATLARVAEPAEEAITNLSNEIAGAPLEPGAVPPAEPAVPPDTLAPPPPASTATARPSFSCASARTRGEVAVCNDEGLAALDRRLTAQYASALAEADSEQRAQLARTRGAFFRFRDQCPNKDCIAQTYRGRMREIEDIMSGEWEPQR